MENKTMNISGQVFNFDNEGYEALKAYLNEMDSSLAGNESKFEIMEDLKTRIVEILTPKKGEVITSGDIVQLRSTMGDMNEAKNLGETVTPKKKWLTKNKLIMLITGSFLGLLLLCASSMVIAREVGKEGFINTPFGWFYQTSETMFNWFFSSSEEMQNWFYKSSDEMKQRYLDEAEEMKKRFLEDSEEMDKWYEEQTDNMYQDYLDRTNDMHNEYDKNTKEMEDEYDQKVNEMLQEFEENTSR